MKFEFEYQCDKDWDEMKGTDRQRHCDSCDKAVHHLSGMTKAQALKFLADRDWDVCVDLFTDAKGNAEFRDREHRFAGQIEGLKQLAASALALVPLALAATFIDCDATAPDESATIVMPISLDGPEPVLEPMILQKSCDPVGVTPDVHVTQVIEDVREVEPEVVPEVVPEVEPANVRVKQRLRGKPKRLPEDGWSRVY